MAKRGEVINLMTGDEMIMVLAENLHADVCRLLAAIIKEDKHGMGEHADKAIQHSRDLLMRMKENEGGSGNG